MANEPLIDSIRQFIVIRPGDRLLLMAEEELTREQVATIKAWVTELMPDVEVVVTSGLRAVVERTDPDACAS